MSEVVHYYGTAHSLSAVCCIFYANICTQIFIFKTMAFMYYENITVTLMCLFASLLFLISDVKKSRLM